MAKSITKFFSVVTMVEGSKDIACSNLQECLTVWGKDEAKQVVWKKTGKLGVQPQVFSKLPNGKTTLLGLSPYSGEVNLTEITGDGGYGESYAFKDKDGNTVKAWDIGLSKEGKIIRIQPKEAAKEAAKAKKDEPNVSDLF